MAAFIAGRWDGSLATELAQAAGELLYRFVTTHWLSKQTFKVVNCSDALLRGEFL